MTSHSRGRALVPLLALQVRSLLYGIGVRRGSGRLRVLGAFALAALLAAIALAYLWALGSGMVAAGAAGAIPALAALAGSLAAVALVFVKAPGTVFGCRDYDLVAALPVPTRVVVVARTAPLYGFAATLSALMSAPLYAAYFSAEPSGPAAVATAAALSVLAPLAPAAVATLASLALASVAVRFVTRARSSSPSRRCSSRPSLPGRSPSAAPRRESTTRRPSPRWVTRQARSPPRPRPPTRPRHGLPRRSARGRQRASSPSRRSRLRSPRS